MSESEGEGINWTLVLGAAAVVGAIYLLNKTSKVATAATDAVSSGIASLFEALTFAPNITASGSVTDPSGAVFPIASLPAATDSNGNTYLTIAGMVYQLGPRGADGNFTAIATGQPAPS